MGYSPEILNASFVLVSKLRLVCPNDFIPQVQIFVYILSDKLCGIHVFFL